jgi:N6-adenosine-specific RNA methylase IME4
MTDKHWGIGVTRYRTIVADPPWDHSDGTGFNYGSKGTKPGRYGEPRTTRPAYKHLTVEEIALVPIDTMAEPSAHLYLWTTQRYLRASFDLMECWGFSVSATLTWCKAPMGFMGGAFRSSTEFVQFGRRGSLAHKSQAPQRWFTWPRVGWTQSEPEAKHSRKPDAFLDLVEQVSPGPYLEMFARRGRLGWDYYGDESLQTAQMPGDHCGHCDDKGKPEGCHDCGTYSASTLGHRIPSGLADGPRGPRNRRHAQR